MEVSYAFIIDTKRVCFLCLKDIPVDFEVDLFPKPFSFRTLSRYLKINLGKVPASPLAQELESTDKVVLLCPECFQEADRFSNLFRELEGIKMKLNLSLKTFHDKVKQSQDDEALRKSLKETMKPKPGEDAGVCDFEFVDNLRTEVAQKCSQKFKTVLPRVQLVKNNEKSTNGEGQQSGNPKIQAESPAVVVDVTSDDAKTGPQISRKSSSLQPEVVHIQDSSTEDHEPEVILEPYIQMDVGRDDSVVFEGPGPNSSHNCEYCSVSYPRQAQIQNHVASVHADQLFAYYRQPSVTEDRFKAILDTILTTITNMGKDNKMFRCSFCSSPEPPKFHKRVNLYGHLFNNHFTEVAQELTTYQAANLNPLQQQQASESVEIDFFDTGDYLERDNGLKVKILQCSLCGKRVSAQSKVGHLRSHKQCMLKCRLCEMTFPKVVTREKHTTQVHYAEMFSACNTNQLPLSRFAEVIDQVLEEILCFKTDPAKRNRCPVCPNVVLENTTAGIWRLHMASEHFDLVAAHIRESLMVGADQGDKEVTLTITDVIKSRIGPTVSRPSPIRRSSTGPGSELEVSSGFTLSGLLTWESKYECGVCGQPFTQASQWKLHEMTCSPNLLLHNFSSSKYKCGQCPVSFSNASLLARHKQMYCQSREDLQPHQVNNNGTGAGYPGTGENFGTGRNVQQHNMMEAPGHRFSNGQVPVLQVRFNYDNAGQNHVQEDDEMEVESQIEDEVGDDPLAIVDPLMFES